MEIACQLILVYEMPYIPHFSGP